LVKKEKNDEKREKVGVFMSGVVKRGKGRPRRRLQESELAAGIG